MRQFEIDKDLATVNEWLQQHGINPFDPSDIPKFGFIVDNVAVGFLAMCEGKTCLIEGFVTNPKSDGKDRNAAIYKLLRGLIEVARETGAKKILGISNHDGLVLRAMECGFFPTKLRVLGLQF